MDNGEKKKDPTVDPAIPLDGIIIANLLAIYLRSEPDRQPFKTPDFRLIELCKYANKNVRTDADIMEAIGAVFVISMHFMMCPMLEDSLVFMECVNLLQTIQIESLVILQKHGRNSIDFIHPTPSLECEQVELFYAFTDGIEYCRQLLREITRAIRVVRDKSAAKSEPIVKPKPKPGAKVEPVSSTNKKEPPTDCYQAMAFYLFTSMAVAHICVVLKNTSEPCVVPGIMESVAMMTYFVPKLIPVKEDKDEIANILNPKKQNNKLQSEITTQKRYMDYMKNVSKIGYAVMFTVFTEKNLKELFMVRSRLMKGLSHPDISFSRLKSVESGAFITSEEVELHHNKQLDIFMEPPRFSVDNILDAGFAIHKDFLINPIIKDESSNDQFKKLENSLVDKNKTNKKTKSIIPLIVPIDSNEADLYWNKITKHLRQAYLVLRPLRKPERSRHYFPPSYTPEFKDAILKPSKKDVSLSEIECHYYYVDRFYCPRHCNPSYVPYWLGYQIIEFLFHKTEAGDGFGRSDSSRAKDIKLQVHLIAKKRLTNNNKTSPIVKLKPIKIQEKPHTVKLSMVEQLANKSRPTTSVDTIAFTNKPSTSNIAEKVPGSSCTVSRSVTPGLFNATTPRGSKILSSSSSKTLSKDPFEIPFPSLLSKSTIKVSPPVVKLDLLGRLSLAKQEAMLEVKLNEIELKMRSKGNEIKKDIKLRYVDNTLQNGLSLVRHAKKVNRAFLLAKSNVLESESVSDLDSMTEDSLLSSEAPTDDQDEASDTIKNDFINFNSKPSSNHGSKATSRMNTSIPGMSREESFVESQGATLLRDIGQFRSELKMGGVVPSAFVAPVNMKVSNVWSSKPIIPKGNDPNALFGQTKNGFNGKTLEEASKEYAAEILKFQKERKEEEERAYTSLQDLQEQEVGISRAHRLNKIRESREERKNTIVITAKIRQFQEDSDKNDKKTIKKEKKEYEKFLEEIKEKETERMMEISAWQSHELYKEQELFQVRQEIELHRLKGMASVKEAKEIDQRNSEEARMKYLEERQREIENRKQKEIDDKHALLVAKRNLTKETRDKLTAKLRMGRFKYSNGKMGFYSDVRPAPIPWTEYNDENGTPYWYDSIFDKTTYEKPTDAPIKHFTEFDRAAYDYEHGEGAYDFMIADHKFKDDYNENNGYYDEENEVWVEATGKYVDYEFVQNEGYYNANGVYVKYAKVGGDLSFMV